MFFRERSTMTDILFENITPVVRYAQILKISGDGGFGVKKAYDSRLFLCTEGEGKITVDKNVYAIKRGTLILWRAGLDYFYDGNKTSPMTLIGINFDFTKQSENKNVPIPPADSDTFRLSEITENAKFSDAPDFNKILCLQNMEELEPKFFEIKDEFIHQKKYFALRCSALAADLLAVIARYAQSGASVMRGKNRADEILTYIHQNYSSEITNRLLSEIFCYHPNYISRLIMNATGMPTHRYVTNYRIARSIDMLQSGRSNVSQACFACGFKDTAHFSKCFKARTGRMPSEFLQR